MIVGRERTGAADLINETLLATRVRGESGRETEASSDEVGASNTIFLFRRLEREREEEKGGLISPTLGVIMYFWFMGGMERVLSIEEERSDILEPGEKVNVWELPWCQIVRLMASKGGKLFKLSGGLEGREFACSSATAIIVHVAK